MYLWSLCLLAVIAARVDAVSFYEKHFEQISSSLGKEQGKNGIPLSWSYGLNDYFKGKSLSDIKNLLGYPLEPPKETDKADFPHPDEYEAENGGIELPKQFDSREKWPTCKSIISYIKDQSNCGSCWAVSAASVMSDRTCISSNGSTAVFLSEEELLSCCRFCGMGCDGGYPPHAFLYWYWYGVPTGGSYGSNNTCKPYSIAPCKACKENSETPSCKKQCVKDYPLDLKKDRHFASTFYRFWLGEKSMMKDIYLYGPIVAGFTVYSDFLYYKAGIYEHRKGDALGGHAVRIIGWGEENKKKYWLVANSWNTTFGEKGLFRIRRGKDECGIESYASAGRAKA